MLLKVEFGTQLQKLAASNLKVERTLLRIKDFSMKRRSVFLSESGATAVEFALILPLLLVLILGLIDFGRMGFVQVSVTSASREGARLSSLDSTGTGSTQTIINYVQAAAPNAAKVSALDGTAALTVLVNQCSTAQSGENTTVTASTNFKWLLPVSLLTLASNSASSLSNFTITSTGTMRCMN